MCLHIYFLVKNAGGRRNLWIRLMNSVNGDLLDLRCNQVVNREGHPSILANICDLW